MSAGLGKCSKIRHIVRLRQMLRRWRNKARMSAQRTPSDVPAGHVAVSVGSNYRRFVVRATYLNHPVFKKLLVEAEEEYGFSNNHGPLAIPCDELLFEELLRFITRSSDSAGSSTRFVSLGVDVGDLRRYDCHPGVGNNLDLYGPDSTPLLTHKTICCCNAPENAEEMAEGCGNEKCSPPSRPGVRIGVDAVHPWNGLIFVRAS